MANDFRSKLACALGVEAPPEPCAIQTAFNTYVRKMCPLVVATPLPENITFLPENFPHLVKLETQSKGWVNAKWRKVGQQLETGMFDQKGFRCDPRRVHALQGIVHLLRRPHAIHLNLRHGPRSPGHIRGKHIYVREHARNEVWVAFTLPDERLGITIVTSSFYTRKQWVTDCASMPPIYSRPPGQH